MSSRLPPEICDNIIDLLHDDLGTLNRCCLVSKSWVSRTRKHLFAHITFREGGGRKWKKAFPDPTNSPAHHTQTLTIDDTLRGAEEDSWIHAFSHVSRLIIEGFWLCCQTTFLVPYRKLAPSLKSLCVKNFLFPYSHVFDLVRFLPFLEDLTLIGYDSSRESDEPPTVAYPPCPPVFTGTLELGLYGGPSGPVHRLLDLANDLHFRRLKLSWFHEQDVLSVANLVVACSGTLESLDFTCGVHDQGALSPIDLSRATKLKDITFRGETTRSAWVFTVLKTVTQENRDLQQIKICLPFAYDYDMSDLEGHTTPEQREETSSKVWWLDLDQLLVQFRESRSIRLKIIGFLTKTGERRIEAWAEYLLPKSMEKGIVEVEERYLQEEPKMRFYMD